MTAADLTRFQTLANTTSRTVFGATIKVASIPRLALFTAPRLSADLADSTVRVDRYTSTVRILKSEVITITAPTDWIGVLIELPEGNGWRSYRAIPELIQDIRLSNEWKLEVESV